MTCHDETNDVIYCRYVYCVIHILLFPRSPRKPTVYHSQYGILVALFETSFLFRTPSNIPYSLVGDLTLRHDIKGVLELRVPTNTNEFHSISLDRKIGGTR